MFAEDVRLLRERIFSNAFDRWLETPEVFPSEVEDLWTKMDQGGTLWGGGRIWRFNGGLFADPAGLPLDRQQLQTLKRAAESDWADVEPAIFGTLLERALDPRERHRLGAHYTPRLYVERLVRPTIEEPLRNEFETVRATVRLLLASPDADANRKTLSDARAEVARFLERLTQVRILDPACGTGNFLYVALDALKRLENEALELHEQLGGAKLTHYGRLVSPQQFLGIEIKRWAKEIAELVLWIGYLQWQVRTKGFEHPDEPILRDYHNIECRDALLDHDETTPLMDDAGRAVTRWDGVTMKRHPATGEEVPDETSRVAVHRYVNPRKAVWPEAEFIVGNPPFIGASRFRSVLGPGYAEALRTAYEDVPEGVDYVMYWWHIAAQRTTEGSVRRFGFITTNSLRQALSRRVTSAFIGNGLSFVFAVPDHPWVDDADGAAVRIAMTSVEKRLTDGQLCTIAKEQDDSGAGAVVDLWCRTGRIGADLRIGADVASARGLLANSRISSPGVKLHGNGFIVDREEAAELIRKEPQSAPLIREYLNGKDVTQRSRNVRVIDTFGLQLADLQQSHPVVLNWLYDRVLPSRTAHDLTADALEYRERWWMFGKPRPELRKALHGLRRFIVTPETAKHRFFVFVGSNVLPDNMLTAIATEDAVHLAVLSSRTHVVWALAAGGRLGVGNDPRYNKTRCFDPFPFPRLSDRASERIGKVAETLDSHRKNRQSFHTGLTMTAMYNVLDKLRSGEPLTAKDKVIHEQGLVSVLRQLHDDVDSAVFDAYGWPHGLTDEEILERLVALNAQRAEEERRGLVRWLRPGFQNPSGTATAQQEIAGTAADAPEARSVGEQVRTWPKELPAQIAAVRELVTGGGSETWNAERAARAFKGARRAQVEAVLESLSALGLLLAIGDGEDRQWKPAA